jgi:hypothetical protein
VTYDRPPLLVPATPEYVLEVFRDSHRQQCQYDGEAEPSIELTFETTISQWRNACDLVGWRELGRALDNQWNLGRSVEDWGAVLEPSRKRTLGELCRLIAGSGAMRPVIEPFTILGSTCQSAGVFLAIRAILRDAGAEVDSLAPSTSLESYTSGYLYAFLGPISRLAPNALPDVRIDESPTGLLGLLGCLVGAGLLFGGEFLSTGSSFEAFVLALIAMSVGFLLIVGTVVWLWLCAGRATPSKVEFGSLRTFGALARVIADGTRPDSPLSAE